MCTSVIICTYNRAALLDRCVDAVGREIVADGGRTEIVVVDSGSTDGTSSAVEVLQRRWPMLRYERLPVPGLSLARNRGIEVASGGVLVFLDDDAEPCQGWLPAIVAPYADPEVAAVGGPARLAWHGRPPRWLTADQSTFFSAVDLGDVGRFLRPQEYPFGVNMSVRLDWARRVGGFQPLLGRRGKSLLSSEELAFYARLEELGGRSWYAPGALVVHHVPAERASLAWLLRRAWGQGRSNVRARRLDAPRLAHLRVRFLVPGENRRRWSHLAAAARHGSGIRGPLADEAVALVELAGAAREWASGGLTRLGRHRPHRRSAVSGAPR